MWLFCQVSLTKHYVAKVDLGGSVYPDFIPLMAWSLVGGSWGYFFAAVKFL